jgi:hypothetical protein
MYQNLSCRPQKVRKVLKVSGHPIQNWENVSSAAKENRSSSSPKMRRIQSAFSAPRNATLYVKVAKEIGDRLTQIFLRDEQGRRPVYGGTEKFQTDPYWRDYILFYEYFHGDNGAGLGASHQTGWTGLVAKLIQLFSLLNSESQLKPEKNGKPRK